MKKIIILSTIALAAILSGCATLIPTTITRNSEDDLKNYSYFYVNPAGAKTGSAGYVTGGNYGVYGSSSTRTTEPCDIISGYLIKLGYVRVATIDENISDKTLVIDNLIEKCDYLLLGGGMCFTFLKANGLNVGASIVDDEN